MYRHIFKMGVADILDRNSPNLMHFVYSEIKSLSAPLYVAMTMGMVYTFVHVGDPSCTTQNVG